MKNDLEDVESFRRRARAWLAENMPRVQGESDPLFDDSRRQRERQLQRKLWDGGFAGICFPAEYGGLGLSIEHQRAFTEESMPYDMPFSFNVPTLSILAATLVDFGTHEQKRRHLPAILKGEDMWVQFLSEPSGGSDLAGSITRADRDGDRWILNGSKIWSSSAHVSDYAMCLARTSWDAPKHRGLTMFIVKIHQPGIQVEQIKQVNGSMEFCQEFFTDVPIPADNVVGEVDGGWAVASALLIHERQGVGGGSPYTSGRTVAGESLQPDRNLIRLAQQTGQAGDGRVRQMVAEGHILQLVSGHLAARITEGISRGEMEPAAGSITKLFHATMFEQRAELGVEIAGSDAVAWPVASAQEAPQVGRIYLGRQTMSLGGGSNEIQRNIIAERVLGMPREWAAGREGPFRDVRTNASASRPNGLSDNRPR
jgi:alkylation response protein AidB-like acyl-CoA dehydrogenase